MGKWAKILLAIVVLVVAVFAYMQTDHYKMSMMDTHAKEGEEAYIDACASFDYARGCTLDMDLDSAYHAISKANENLNKSMESWQTAYGYAKGPYKEFIGMQIDILKDFEKAIDYLFDGIVELMFGEEDKGSVYIEEARKYVNSIREKVQKQNEFLKSHPEVKKHIIEKWGIEESDLTRPARAPLPF
ncbi:hypothetical protein H5T55_07815 [Candidatus Bipolaricaulota bacterium]|nr:hypothetical protein [Candidatus Bipolaricaulota bacterium]